MEAKIPMWIRDSNDRAVWDLFKGPRFRVQVFFFEGARLMVLYLDNRGVDYVHAGRASHARCILARWWASHIQSLSEHELMEYIAIGLIADEAELEFLLKF